MKQKLINVYEFEELKDNIKEKVIDRFRNKNDYYFLKENLEESLKELLEQHNIKFEDFNLFYSLSYCQGDGLCFIGTFNFKGFRFFVTHHSRYYHKHSTDIEMQEDYEEDDELKNLINSKVKEATEGEFKGIYYKICGELEKEGYDFIEYEDSEENIKEIINLNEYTFMENGELI
jgi:hypothetical protein